MHPNVNDKETLNLWLQCAMNSFLQVAEDTSHAWPMQKDIFYTKLEYTQSQDCVTHSWNRTCVSVSRLGIKLS